MELNKELKLISKEDEAVAKEGHFEDIFQKIVDSVKERECWLEEKQI